MARRVPAKALLFIVKDSRQRIRLPCHFTMHCQSQEELDKWFATKVRGVMERVQQRITSLEKPSAKLCSSRANGQSIPVTSKLGTLRGQIVNISEIPASEIRCEECGRFFSEMVCSQRLVRLNCGHYFHRDCLCQHLVSNNCCSCGLKIVGPGQ